MTCKQWDYDFVMLYILFNACFFSDILVGGYFPAVFVLLLLLLFRIVLPFDLVVFYENHTPEQ